MKCVASSLSNDAEVQRVSDSEGWQYTSKTHYRDYLAKKNEGEGE